ncbi:hypothetical protein E1166_01385 [Micromonospora sp. KC213]|nr:hypothetical protein E1166_01385 [Micromonospora sp. KC213]
MATHCKDPRYADAGSTRSPSSTAQLRAKGINPVIARRGVGHGCGLGARRWVVEQTIALPHWFRRPRTRWEIRDDIHEAFLTLACALLCCRRLQHPEVRSGKPPTITGPMGSGCHSG